MKKILFSIITLFIFSCNLTDESKGRNAYKDYLKETLKDPESLIIYNERIEKSSNEEITYYVDYGAKNSYGGMVRETLKVVTLNGRIISTEDDYHEVIIDESEDETVDNYIISNNDYSQKDVVIGKFYIGQVYDNNTSKYLYTNPKDINENYFIIYDNRINFKNNDYDYLFSNNTYHLSKYNSEVGYIKINNINNVIELETDIYSNKNKFIISKID